MITLFLLALSAFHGFAAEMALDPDPGNGIPLQTAGLPSRIIIVAIDSLNPEYADFDATASGPGGLGNWLMPNVRAFVERSAWWPKARAFFPQATDMNHLNVLAGTHSGLTGIVGVSQQPEAWRALGMKLGEIHVSKAKYPDGNQVQTLFDLLKEVKGDGVTRAFVSNKGWVAEMYTGSVEIIVTGENHPTYVPEPYFLSFYDNPLTDPDQTCDPESLYQTLLLDWTSWQKPLDHPRDFWIADAALQVMQNESPDMMYVLLGDLDHGQHFLGSVANPDEWVEGPQPALPDGCKPQPGYNLVSRRNSRLFKEPVLDLIRDVDLAFGQLIDGLEQGGYLDDTVVFLVSDHNMINYLYRDGILELTDVKAILKAVGLAPKRSFYSYGAGSVGLLYWRPVYKFLHPNVVARAKAELLSDTHAVFNHETGQTELPWAIMDRRDMILGRSDLGIGPMEFYNLYFVRNGVWPDLAVVMKDGWQLPSGSFNLGGGTEFTLLNAGHGAPDTAQVMLAIRASGVPAGLTCSEEASLADVGVSLADWLGTVFPQSVGHVLTCTPPR
jgi:hypothetical protein